MRAAVLLFFVSFALAGCLDGADQNDASANVDMAKNYDLFGVDLLGAYNCTQLNACTKLCKNLMCVTACRQMATPSAMSKEFALQQCFFKYCPQTGGSEICKQDEMTGQFSAACVQCIANTQKASTTECSPQSAPECRLCYNESQDCKNDQ